MSIPDGPRREVREETGLTVEPDALTGVYKNVARGAVALVFRCHATGGVLGATAEADDRTELELGDLSDESGVNDRDQFLRNRIERGCLGHPASRVR